MSIRPFAGMTRIRFEGSPRHPAPLGQRHGGISAPSRSSPRNVLNVGWWWRVSTPRCRHALVPTRTAS